jgi:dipeptidyl aminopeptidase/acylaminoacyl peptidase
MLQSFFSFPPLTRRRVAIWLILLIGVMAFGPLGTLYTATHPPEVESGLTPSDFNVSHESVTFTTSDDVKLSGWFIPSARGTSSVPTVIFAHGYPAEKGDLLPFALQFRDSFNLFLFDFRSFGDSEGAVTTIGQREVKDMHAAVSYLQSRDIDRIGAWGFSMGGAVSLMHAAEHGSLDAVVSEASYANLELLAKRQFRIPIVRTVLARVLDGWARIVYGVSLRDPSPLGALDSIGTPTLITHGIADPVIPVTHARKLQAAAADNGAVAVWVRTGGGHGGFSGAYDKRVREFLRTQLYGTGSQ